MPRTDWLVPGSFNHPYECEGKKYTCTARPNLRAATVRLDMAPVVRLDLAPFRSLCLWQVLDQNDTCYIAMSLAGLRSVCLKVTVDSHTQRVISHLLHPYGRWSDMPPLTSDMPPLTSDMPPLTSDVPPLTSLPCHIAPHTSGGTSHLIHPYASSHLIHPYFFGGI